MPLRHSMDRREFLAGSVAAVATAAAATTVAADASSTRVLVDWHSHFVSNAEMKFFASRHEAPRLLTSPDGVTRLDNVDTQRQLIYVDNSQVLLKSKGRV